MALDLSSMWLPELEMENNGFINQDDTSKPYNQTEMNPLSCDNKSSSINTMCQTPKAVAAASPSSSNAFTISFGELNPKDDTLMFNDSHGISGTGKAQTMARAPVQAQDHVLAERKRREKLNRQLISLSTLLPNLKKMNKASVLEDAANYIKELQDRVKELEELSGLKRKEARECIIALNRSRIKEDDHDSSSNDTNYADCCVDVACNSSAEIEVRMSGSSVLVRIQAPKNAVLLVKVLSMMQTLGLSIISSSAIPFANTTTLITIVAQIEGDFFITATDLIKNLQLAI